MAAKNTPSERDVINAITTMFNLELSRERNLYKAQKAVEKRLKECQRQATEAVLEQRSTEAGLKASSSIPCACGKSELKLNGRDRSRTLDLVCGQVSYSRPYYAPNGDECGCKGRFPFDEELGITRGALDVRTVEHISVLSVMTPYQQAIALTQRLLDIKVSKKRAVTTVGKVGELAFEQRKRRAESRWADRAELIASRPARPERSGRLFISVDGTCVGIKKSESFKECKSAVLFWESDIEPRRKRSYSRTASKRRRPDRTVKRKRIVSFVGSHEEFLPYVWDAFVEMGGLDAMQVIFIADGADWIWNDCRTLFPPEHFDVLELLDWYHLFEHLWDAVKVYHKNEETQQGWISKMKRLQRFRDTGQGIAAELRGWLDQPLTAAKRETIEKALSYVESNTGRMTYARFRIMDWPRGSAIIESVNHGVIQARFKLPGMRWTVQGANQMLCLRNAYFSDLWEEVFNAAMEPLLHLPPAERSGEDISAAEAALAGDHQNLEKAA